MRRFVFAIALLAIASAVVAFTGSQLYRFLAINEPVGGTLLVVEGWMVPAELDGALIPLRAGHYQLIVTSGGPLYDAWHSEGPATFAERAAAYLNGFLTDKPVVPVPAPDTPTDRTYTSAVAVREWLKASHVTVTSLDVFSWGPHARRSRDLYRLAFGPQVQVGVFAAEPAAGGFDAWYRTSYATEEMLKELAGYIWIKCCFWPSSSGSGS